jgi:hypothetical protein
LSVPVTVMVPSRGERQRHSGVLKVVADVAAFRVPA